MTASKPPNSQTTLIKVLFWCLAAPMMALMFFRLFFFLFRFVYGTVLILLLGQQAAHSILILSTATALVFTVGAIGYAYKQLKTHIIGQ